MARLPPNHPSKRRNRNRGGQNDIGADSSLLNESNSSSFFPSNSSRGRTESVPTLNVSGTVTPPASVELERDRTPIRTPNLLGGCSGTISTPTGSRNATTAPRVLRPRENVVRSRCLAPLNLAATPNSSSSSEGHDLAIFARVQEFFTRQEQFNALIKTKLEWTARERESAYHSNSEQAATKRVVGKLLVPLNRYH